MLKKDDSLFQKLYWQLLPASILSFLMPNINSLVDSIIASHTIGPEAMSAVGIIGPITSLLNGIAAILYGGSLVVVGSYIGKGQRKKVDQVLSTDLWATLSILTLFTILLYLFPRRIISLTGVNNDQSKAAVSYLVGIAFGFPATYASPHLSTFLEMEQRHKRNIIGILLMIATNTILDLVFVSILHLGIAGFGLASALASWIYFFILFPHYLSRKAKYHCHIKNIKVKYLPEIITIGIPLGFSSIFLALRGYVTNLYIIKTGGELGLAAYAIAGSIGPFVLAFGLGITDAFRTMVSVFHGSGDRNAIETVARVTFRRMLPLNAALGLIFVFLAKPILLIFNIRQFDAIYPIALTLVRLLPFIFFNSSLFALTTKYYQCFKRAKINSALSFTDSFLGMFLLLPIFTRLFGLNGVWFSWLGSGILVNIVILTYTICNLKHFPRTVNDWLIFPKGFGVIDKHRLDLSISSKEDIASCGEALLEFCREQGYEEEIILHAKEALEEMAGNVVEYGFRKNSRCIVSIANKRKKLVIQIMDNCYFYDPTKLIAECTKLDPSSTKHYGIRQVMAHTKKITYRSILGLNYLKIIL